MKQAILKVLAVIISAAIPIIILYTALGLSWMFLAFVQAYIIAYNLIIYKVTTAPFKLTEMILLDTLIMLISLGLITTIPTCS